MLFRSDTFRADDLQKDLIAGRRPRANQQVDGVLRLLDDDGGLGGGKAVLFIRLGPVPQFPCSDVWRRRQLLEPGQKVLDAYGLRGVNDRFDELPDAIGAISTDLRVRSGTDLHAGNRGDVQVRQDPKRYTAVLAHVPLVEENEGKEPRGHSNPAPSIPGIHAGGLSSAPQPDQAAEEQHRARQPGEQHPLRLMQLSLTHHQVVFIDEPRPKASQ